LSCTETGSATSSDVAQDWVDAPEGSLTQQCIALIHRRGPDGHGTVSVDTHVEAGALA